MTWPNKWATSNLLHVYSWCFIEWLKNKSGRLVEAKLLLLPSNVWWLLWLQCDAKKQITVVNRLLWCEPHMHTENSYSYPYYIVYCIHCTCHSQTINNIIMMSVHVRPTSVWSDVLSDDVSKIIIITDTTRVTLGSWHGLGVWALLWSMHCDSIYIIHYCFRLETLGEG